MNTCAHPINDNKRQIVLDTNCLLVSIPKSSPYRNVWDAFLRGDFVLCYSNEILEEYEEIIAQKTSFEIAQNIIKILLERSNVRKIDVYYKFCIIENDPDDNKFVDCAIAAGADYIVSNDKHLGIVKTIDFPKIDVISISAFSEMLNKK